VPPAPDVVDLARGKRRHHQCAEGAADDEAKNQPAEKPHEASPLVRRRDAATSRQCLGEARMVGRGTERGYAEHQVIERMSGEVSAATVRSDTLMTEDGAL
jgi:hypothetical protein